MHAGDTKAHTLTNITTPHTSKHEDKNIQSVNPTRPVLYSHKRLGIEDSPTLSCSGRLDCYVGPKRSTARTRSA